MAFLKVAAVGLTLAMVAGWYLDQLWSNTKAPVLPETWWRPGNEKTVTPGIRKFNVAISKEVIDDLKHRLKNTRFGAEPLEGTGWRYGTSTLSLRKIVDYWGNKYDFKKREAHLNQYPHFITNVQGLDIHFIHVKPQNAAGKRVLPIMLQHGWPGSIVEFYKIIPLLTTPRPEYDFVFEVVAPSLPGYAFSDGATIEGLGPGSMAVVLKNLMMKLGFKQFYAQGGDWGAVVISDMGAMFPERLLGIHLNMCTVNTPKAFLKTFLYSLAPSLFVAPEDAERMFPLKDHLAEILKESGYFHIQATKPDTVAAGLSDSPAGLAAYILEKFSVGTNKTFKAFDDGRLTEKFTMDELLDNLMLYWIPNKISTAVRVYAEHHSRGDLDWAPINVPCACAQFPNEIAHVPQSILKDRYKKLVRVTRMEKGGHFAAMEEPKALADDIWLSIAEMEALRKAPPKKKE